MRSVGQLGASMLIAAGVLWGQAPLLTLSHLPVSDRPGFYQTRVTNNWGVPAAAVDVRVGTQEPARGGNGQKAGLQYRAGWALETVPGIDRPLGPGESKLCGTTQWPLAEVRCVIYADGTSAGDMACVNQFLHERRELLKDIAKITKKIEEALQEDAPDLDALLRFFREEEKARNNRDSKRARELDIGGGAVPGKAYRTIVLNLEADAKRTFGSIPIKVRLQNLLATMNRWESQLNDSKPALK